MPIAQDGTGEIVLGLSCEDAQDKDDWRLRIRGQLPNVWFYQLGLNLGIAIPRSEDIPRFILGLSFGVLSAFSNL